MPILELEMLAKMLHSYFIHFVKYSCTRKNVTHLVYSLVWRKVYKGFHEGFLNITY